MSLPDCNRRMMWVGVASILLSSTVSAGNGGGNSRNQGFGGGGSRITSPFAQNSSQPLFRGQSPATTQTQQKVFNPQTPVPKQPFQLPTGQGPQLGQKIQSSPGNKIQRPLGQPPFGGGLGKVEQVQQLKPGANRPPLIKSPSTTIGGQEQKKGTLGSKVVEQRNAKPGGNSFLPGQLGGGKPPGASNPVLTTKKNATIKPPGLDGKTPFNNPKPIQRLVDPKKFGLGDPVQKQPVRKPGIKLQDRDKNRIATRKFSPFQHNHQLVGMKLTDGIEGKIAGLANGSTRVNDPKIVANFLSGNVDFADKLAAEKALQRFRLKRATDQDHDLIRQLGGIKQLMLAAGTDVCLPDFSTDADVFDEVDSAGGCILATILSPPCVDDGGFADSTVDDETVDEIETADATDSTEPDQAEPANEVQLIHPYADSSQVNFSIDGTDQHISPGVMAAYALPRGSKGEIRFETGTGTTTRYTLTAGEYYEFYAKDGAWDLRKKQPEDVMAANAPTELALEDAAQIEAGEKADPAEEPAAVETAQTEESEPADAAEVPAPQPPKRITGRFAIVNPTENEVELKFLVNGEQRSLAAGKVAILNVMDNTTTVAFPTGAQEAFVERTVIIGKAYEFWNNDGVWDLREKEVPQQRVATTEAN